MVHSKSKPKKARFYSDENIFPKTVSFIRSKKVNILHSVADLGFAGRDDLFHFSQSAKLERVLLTLDTDFLNNKRFKVEKTSGVIILIVPPPVTSEKVNKLILENISIFRNKKEQLKGKRVKISIESVTWT